MSCFDSLKWNPYLDPGIDPLPLEHSKAPDWYYHFKEFGCNLSIYGINSELELVLLTDRSNGVDAHLHLNYTGELELAGANDSFLLTFENAKLIAVEKLIDQ